ncbi:hypothetical protein HYH03_002359 [Edaphochlamys debaryana]|uniref:sn-1-specific diacylglycerol lipase n=1 Tax=Edaphochlamys debaryana TaxID=47281 RepID=A0A836C5U9_9CHLO|nr:hypothetical protein HYH03_002359 [Edaphochlamys debaryana]|eukprot:KAG2500082.1 hypothetical protein HYH03_002359 [Edaphochlamys debaryana]
MPALVLFAAALEWWLVFEGLKGRPLETKARRGVPWLLGLHTVASAVEVLVAAYGSLLLAFHVELCSHWGSRPLAVALVWTSWGLIAFNALLTAVAYNPWHGLDLVEAWESGFVALGRLLRQRGLLSAKGTAQEASDSTQRRLAELCASMIQHVDLTLSDAATAMLLVSVAQDMRRRRVLREAMVAAAQAAGLSSLSRQTTAEALTDEALAREAARQVLALAAATQQLPAKPRSSTVADRPAAAAAGPGAAAIRPLGDAGRPRLPPAVTLHPPPTSRLGRVEEEPAKERAGDSLASDLIADGMADVSGTKGFAGGETHPPSTALAETGAPRRQDSGRADHGMGGRPTVGGNPAAFTLPVLPQKPSLSAPGLRRARFGTPGSGTPHDPSAAAAAAVPLAPCTPDASDDDGKFDASLDLWISDDDGPLGRAKLSARASAGAARGSEHGPPAASRFAVGATADDSGGVGSVKRAAAAIEAALAAGATTSGLVPKAEMFTLTPGAFAARGASAATVASPAAAAGDNDSDGDDFDPFCTFLPMPPAAVSSADVAGDGTGGALSPTGPPAGLAAARTRATGTTVGAEARGEEAEKLQDPAAEAAAGASGSEGGVAPAVKAAGVSPGPFGTALAASSLGGLEGRGATASEQRTAEQAPSPFMLYQQKMPAPTASLSPRQPFAAAQMVGVPTAPTAGSPPQPFAAAQMAGVSTAPTAGSPPQPFAAAQMAGVPTAPTAGSPPQPFAAAQMAGVPTAPTAGSPPQPFAAAQMAGVPTAPTAGSPPQPFAAAQMVGVPTAPTAGSPPQPFAAAQMAGVPTAPTAGSPPQPFAAAQMVGVPTAPTVGSPPQPFAAAQMAGVPTPPTVGSPPQPFAAAQAVGASSPDGAPPLLQPAGSSWAFTIAEGPSEPSPPAAAVGMAKGAEPKTALGLAGTTAVPPRAFTSADVGHVLLPPSVSVLHNMLHLTPVGLEKHLQELAEEMEEEAEAQASMSEAGASQAADATADGAEPEAAGGQGRAAGSAPPVSSSFQPRSVGSASLESKIASDAEAATLRQRIADAALAAAFGAERPTVDRSTLEEARVYGRYAAAVYGDFDADSGEEVAGWQTRYGWRLRLGLISAQDAMRSGIRECLEQITPHVIHVNTENSMEGYLPYAVSLDEATRSVVISIRGTASLEDAITDVLLAPYDVSDLLPSGGLTGDGGSSGGGGGATSSGGGNGATSGADDEKPVLLAHGGIWGAADAVLADLQHLGLLELLFPVLRGGGAASSAATSAASAAAVSAPAMPVSRPNSASAATAGAAGAQAAASACGGHERPRLPRWKALGAEAPPKLLSAELSGGGRGPLSSASSRIMGAGSGGSDGGKGWTALRSNMSRLVTSSLTAGGGAEGGGGWTALLSQMSRLRAGASGSSQASSAGGDGGALSSRNSVWPGLLSKLTSPAKVVVQTGADRSDGNGQVGGGSTLRPRPTGQTPAAKAYGGVTGGLDGLRSMLTPLASYMATQLTEAGSRLLGDFTGGRGGKEEPEGGSTAGRALAKNRSRMSSRRATSVKRPTTTAASHDSDAQAASAPPDGGGGTPSAVKRLMITLPLPLPTRDEPGPSGRGARPWRLVVTGHSLGGGAAALLALRLRAALPHVEVKAWCFEPPGALAGPELSAAMRPFCVSVVAGTDLVPRITPQTLERYRDEMMTALARCSCSKAEVLLGSLTKTSRARRAARLLLPYEEIPPEAAETLWRYHQATQEVERLPELHAPGKILYLQPSVITVMQPPAVEPTAAPDRAGSGDRGSSSGRRLAKQTSSLLRRVPFFYGAAPPAVQPTAGTPALRYRPVWVTAAELSAEGILASERMLADHNLPRGALSALDQLLGSAK